jgi:hypothetical protein
MEEKGKKKKKKRGCSKSESRSERERIIERKWKTHKRETERGALSEGAQMTPAKERKKRNEPHTQRRSSGERNKKGKGSASPNLGPAICVLVSFVDFPTQSETGSVSGQAFGTSHLRILVYCPDAPQKARTPSRERKPTATGWTPAAKRHPLQERSTAS